MAIWFKNAGDLADDDFADRVKKCIGIMMHAPVTASVDWHLKIIPMRPLKTCAEWKYVIGFYPNEICLLN